MKNKVEINRSAFFEVEVIPEWGRMEKNAGESDC